MCLPTSEGSCCSAAFSASVKHIPVASPSRAGQPVWAQRNTGKFRRGGQALLVFQEAVNSQNSALVSLQCASKTDVADGMKQVSMSSEGLPNFGPTGPWVDPCHFQPEFPPLFAFLLFGVPFVFHYPGKKDFCLLGFRFQPRLEMIYF